MRVTHMNNVDQRVLQVLSAGPARDLELHSITGSKGHPAYFFEKLVRNGMVAKRRDGRYKITDEGKEALKIYQDQGYYTFYS